MKLNSPAPQTVHLSGLISSVFASLALGSAQAQTKDLSHWLNCSLYGSKMLGPDTRCGYRGSSAAKEIKILIDQSAEEVRLGAVYVDQARATIEDVVVSIRRVSDTVTEISAASKEQSEGVQQVGEAVVQLDHATQQNAALVEQMAAAAGSLSQQAQQLVDAVARFELGSTYA